MKNICKTGLKLKSFKLFFQFSPKSLFLPNQIIKLLESCSSAKSFNSINFKNCQKKVLAPGKTFLKVLIIVFKDAPAQGFL